MLVIGHRGARGLAPENTLDSMNAAVRAGALILEFDIQLTRDGVPVVVHDKNLRRTHQHRTRISSLTANELTILTTDHMPVPTLHQILETYWGKMYLNIEVKGRGTGLAVAHLLQEYCKQPSDWENCFISSFNTRELRAIRKFSPHATLALLHYRNPYTFLAYHRQLNLSAVGWHRLHTNQLVTETAKKMGLFTYAYTVNRPRAAQIFKDQGFDAIVTDYPDRIFGEVELD